jgi:hypothetical protein
MLSAALFTAQVFAQCTSLQTDELSRQMLETFQQYKSTPEYEAARQSTNPIIVPLVFHVVENDIYVTPNSSDSTLYRLVNRLNVYYAKMNSDTGMIPAAFQPLASASNIHFCLAATDPNGNATTGILRVPSSHGPFSSSQVNDLLQTSLGGHDPWPFTQFLNIYVCGMTSGYLGFAGHGYAALSYVNINGTTSVHEIGHSFGLVHTFGFSPYTCSDDDGISDTPREWGPAPGTPTYPYYDSCTTSGDGINFMNIMDYAQQRTMFTAEQVAFMEYVLTTNSDYVSMIATNNCSTVEVAGIAKEEIFRISPNPSHGVFTVNHRGALTVYDETGRLILSQTLVSGFTIVSFPFSKGIYFVKLHNDEKVMTQKLVIE